MNRPWDPIQMMTKESEATGERRHSNIDDDEEDKFDIDIEEFDIGLCADDDVEPGFLEPLRQADLRSSDAVIGRAPISKNNIIPIAIESECLLATPSNEPSLHQSNETPDHTPITARPNHDCRTILTFIAGAVVGGETRQSNPDNEHSLVTDSLTMPSIASAAATWGKELDEKQSIAFKVLCCLFFL